jgi:hypothetical protein
MPTDSGLAIGTSDCANRHPEKATARTAILALRVIDNPSTSSNEFTRIHLPWRGVVADFGQVVTFSHEKIHR